MFFNNCKSNSQKILKCMWRNPLAQKESLVKKQKNKKKLFLKMSESQKYTAY